MILYVWNALTAIVTIIAVWVRLEGSSLLRGPSVIKRARPKIRSCVDGIQAARAESRERSAFTAL
jgi:hypothetical protein